MSDQRMQMIETIIKATGHEKHRLMEMSDEELAQWYETAYSYAGEWAVEDL